MNNNTYDPKQKRILDEVKRMLEDLFPSIDKLPEPDPICYKCKVVMCKVLDKGESYFWCAERGCGHREYWI